MRLQRRLRTNSRRMKENRERTSFVFLLKWAEVLKGYPREVRYEVMDAIIAYAQSGALIELKPLAKMAFAFIRKEMDYYFERHEAVSVRRSEASRKRWSNPSPSSPDCTLTEADEAAACNCMYNEYINEKDKDKEEEEEEEEEAAAESFSCGGLISFFNSEMGRAGAAVPRIKSLDGARLEQVRSRLREHGKEALAAMIRKAAVSDFLNGRNERGFTATFDWLIRPANFVKVIEGNYDNKDNNNQKTQRSNGIIQRSTTSQRRGALEVSATSADDYKTTF